MLKKIDLSNHLKYYANLPLARCIACAGSMA